MRGAAEPAGPRGGVGFLLHLAEDLGCFEASDYVPFKRLDARTRAAL